MVWHDLGRWYIFIFVDCISDSSFFQGRVKELREMIEKKDKSYCISFEDYYYCNGWNDAVDAIGRCKDCVWSREPTKEDYAEIGRDVLA